MGLYFDVVMAKVFVVETALRYIVVVAVAARMDWYFGVAMVVA